MRALACLAICLFLARTALAGGDAEFGAWMQLEPTDPNLRTVSMKLSGKGPEGRPPESGFSYYELRVAVKNPNPTPWGSFNAGHYRWAVLDSKGMARPVDSAMVDVLTGKSGEYQFLPGQAMEFIYYLQVPKGVTPAGLKVSTSVDHYRTIRLNPQLLRGGRVAAKPGDAPGTKPMPGVNPRPGDWARIPGTDDLSINLTGITSSDRWTDGRSGGGGTILHANFTFRNDSSGEWGVFNSSTHTIMVMNGDDTTISLETELYDARTKKPADEHTFRKGERKDYIIDIAIPKTAKPVKLMVLRGDAVLRYDLTKAFK